MSTVLGWLTPWWVKLAIVAALFSGVLWVKHAYDVNVTKQAVATALVKERAVTDPAFKELTANFKTLESTFKQITDASNAERDRRVAEINKKTKDLNYALSQNKTLKADLAKLHGLSAELDGVLNTIASINNSASGASASARLKQLGTAHAACERALRESDGDLAETLGRLDEALSVVRALKN